MRILKLAPLLFSLSIIPAFSEDDHDHEDHDHEDHFALVEQLGFEIAAVEDRIIGDKEVTALPISGVFVQDGKNFALVQNDKEDHEFTKWEVKLGKSDGSFVEALAGVFPGDKVVVKHDQLETIKPEKLVIVKNTIPQKPVETKGSTNYGVQIGAFSKATNAVRVADQLKADFGRTDVLVSESNGKSLYRVRVGEFSTMTSAKDTKEKLKAKGFSGAFVVAFK